MAIHIHFPAARTKRSKKKPLVGSAIFAVIVLGLYIAKEAGWIKPGTNATSTTSQPSRPPSDVANSSVTTQRPASESTADPESGQAVETAFRMRRSDVWLEATGVIVKVLPDDRDGDAHQKLLVRIDGAERITVMIAHNIDAAPRVPVEEGDRIRFRGEYEWTDKGGTVHFTHAPKFERDAGGGWIDFRSRRYE